MKRRQFVGSMFALPLAAQQYVPQQSDRPETLTGDETGFKPIFDGKTLDGWEGDPKYWRAENGSLVGEITPDTLIKSNTFIIWRGGSPKDFELKADYRMTSGGNSGINYRSVVVPDTVTPCHRMPSSPSWRCSTWRGWWASNRRPATWRPSPDRRRPSPP